MKASAVWLIVLLTASARVSAAQPAPEEPMARVVAPQGVVSAVRLRGAEAPVLSPSGDEAVDQWLQPGSYSISFLCASRSGGGKQPGPAPKPIPGEYTLALKGEHVYRLSCAANAAGVLRVVEWPPQPVNVPMPRYVVEHVLNTTPSAAFSRVPGLPPYFASMRSVDIDPLPASPADLGRRLERSDCDERRWDPDSVSMFIGMATRPGTGEELLLDRGELPDGTLWFALRSRADSSSAYCGVVASPASGGSNIALLGVSSAKQADALEKVASGRFFCDCHLLNK